MIKRKKKDHKTANFTRRQGVRKVKQSFLIICEGKNTEPDYFKAFRVTTASVKAIGEAMNTMSFVNKAINIREAEKSKKSETGRCTVAPTYLALPMYQGFSRVETQKSTQAIVS